MGLRASTPLGVDWLAAWCPFRGISQAHLRSKVHWHNNLQHACLLTTLYGYFPLATRAI